MMCAHMVIDLSWNAYVHNAAMSFRVHHYIGSWETFRQPGFDARGKDMFDKRNNVRDLVVDNTTHNPSIFAKWRQYLADTICKACREEKGFRTNSKDACS
eukprot:scaffold9279_cov150-Skeletonema_marinoi.AAC.2